MSLLREMSSHTAPAKPAILPAPFEWIYIPAGQVRLQYALYNRLPSYVVDVADFFIAKYPVTNEQYNVYVQETGRKIDRRNFEEPEFNQPLQPVIDVRWHEAMLFCQWLSEKVGYLVTLPTDAQWQRAAQGDDDRRYPWGNDWDSTRCNTGAARIGYTTPVTQYPEGASPYSVMDMIGNVPEWCLTDANTGANSLDFEIPTTLEYTGDERIFKGGGFGSKAQAVTRGQDVIESGAISMHWYSYACGIRLVTTATAKQ